MCIYIYIYIYIYIGVRGSPERGYFVPACVWSGRWAGFGSCSRIGACAFEVFWGGGGRGWGWGWGGEGLNPLKTLLFSSKNIKNTDIRPPEPQKVVFWATNEKRTRGASPGLVFWVHRKSEGEATFQREISLVVGGAARGREAGGTRFDSPFARFL